MVIPGIQVNLLIIVMMAKLLIPVNQMILVNMVILHSKYRNSGESGDSDSLVDSGDFCDYGESGESDDSTELADSD